MKENGKALEKLVNETGDKIFQLKLKVKNMKSKKDMEAKETSTRSEDPKKVTNQKGNSKDSKLNKTKPNASVFMFGAHARKAVSNQNKSEEKNISECF